MKSAVKLYGPRIPIAQAKLMELVNNLDQFDIPIKYGELSFGRFDFIFHWKQMPEPEPLLKLIELIDKLLFDNKLPTRYSITSETYRMSKIAYELEEQKLTEGIYSLVRIHGPSLLEGLKAVERVIEKEVLESTSPFKTLKGSVLIGEYDFAFQWKKYPSHGEMHHVMREIDKEIVNTGAIYTITTKRKVLKTDKLMVDPHSDNLMAFL